MTDEDMKSRQIVMKGWNIWQVLHGTGFLPAGQTLQWIMKLEPWCTKALPHTSCRASGKLSQKQLRNFLFLLHSRPAALQLGHLRKRYAAVNLQGSFFARDLSAQSLLVFM